MVLRQHSTMTIPERVQMSPVTIIQFSTPQRSILFQNSTIGFEILGN